MSIPIANPVISDTARESVDEVLESGMIADGEVVRAFESEFADFVGTEYAVATANGTTALHAMFEAVGIGDGDAVVTSPFSFIASANAVVHAGGTPVFGDIRKDTFNIDAEAVYDIVCERDDVVGIMPIHLYGLSAEMDAIREIAEEHDLILFEDAAQAHGAEYRGQSVGSIGDAAVFSFYPTKNMTTGEGGMVTTDDEEIAARLRKIVNHGRTDTYEHVFKGYNYRMTNIQAAIGREQLRRLPEWVEKRQANAATLSNELSDIDGIKTPKVPHNRKHAFHQYTIAVDDRDSVIRSLDNHGVGYGIYYPKVIPKQPAYDQEREYPVAEKATGNVLSIPVHPQVSESDLETIASAIRMGIQEQ